MGADELATRRWQTYRRTLLGILPPVCHICGQPINKGLPGTHPDGPTIDHLTPRSRGGQVYDKQNCALAHQRCNSARGNQPHTIHSRDW